MAKNQKSYTPEFKQQIVDLYNLSGYFSNYGFLHGGKKGRTRKGNTPGIPFQDTQHQISVRERRTAINWAEEIQYLVDIRYPDCDRIILIMDNLNTHALSSLYKTFPASEAGRIAKKLEIHDTPKHGSWLNIAEIELKVMTHQCLCRRIGDMDVLRQELASWENDRNQHTACSQWQFTTDKARIKLVSLYPKFGLAEEND